ncbi:MAG: hypothetical protein C5B59_11630 [Bacteroidetes bacterium]|nr:MAG: hypothetical protein C5B59_11630 [Bacteroidota bacterium]
MKNYFFLFLFETLVFISCGHPEQPKSEPVATNDSADVKNYFPVEDFLRSEISYVDSFPLRIVRYHTVGTKTDSGFIKSSDFDQMAKAFLPADLNDSAFQKKFTESSFIDQSTHLITFTYSTKNNQSGLQRVDVMATRGMNSDKVKSIYMEILENKNDSSIIKKMYWVAKKSFDIATIMQSGEQSSLLSRTRVVWDVGE